ncbi:MAG TPA: hypothetical protein VFQ43_18300 [Nitrososphaera sp.]|nr:hypothetical protein [Nitrososphaera sp.]
MIVSSSSMVVPFNHKSVRRQFGKLLAFLLLAMVTLARQPLTASCSPSDIPTGTPEVTRSDKTHGGREEPGSQQIEPEEWAQLSLNQCLAEEQHGKERLALPEVEIQKTAQSKEELGFVQEENRSLRKALLKQHRPYFARLDYLLLGQKARSLEPAAERFRQAAQATCTQNNNSPSHS